MHFSRLITLAAIFAAQCLHAVPEGGGKDGYDPKNDPLISHLLDKDLPVEDDGLAIYGKALYKSKKSGIIVTEQFNDRLQAEIDRRQALVDQNLPPKAIAPRTIGNGHLVPRKGKHVTKAPKTPAQSGGQLPPLPPLFPQARPGASNSTSPFGMPSYMTGNQATQGPFPFAGSSMAPSAGYQGLQGPSMAPFGGSSSFQASSFAASPRTLAHQPIGHLFIRSPDGTPDMWESEANALRAALPNAALVLRAYQYERERRRREALFKSGQPITPKALPPPAPASPPLNPMKRALMGSPAPPVPSSSSAKPPQRPVSPRGGPVAKPAPTAVPASPRATAPATAAPSAPKSNGHSSHGSPRLSPIQVKRVGGAANGVPAAPKAKAPTAPKKQVKGKAPATAAAMAKSKPKTVKKTRTSPPVRQNSTAGDTAQSGE